MFLGNMSTALILRFGAPSISRQ
uniref:Uncharacterized protein n=1 Tax=Arundo donax TaxID=35708 RepID=A0A0A9HER8_ARUDO